MYVFFSLYDELMIKTSGDKVAAHLKIVSTSSNNNISYGLCAYLFFSQISSSQYVYFTFIFVYLHGRENSVVHNLVSIM